MSVSFDRTSDTVKRVAEGKRGQIVTQSRAYVVHRFRSSTLADAAATALIERRKRGEEVDGKAILLDAAVDPRGFLHVSEAAQVVAEAQLRTIGSRPTGKHVARKLEAWDGRGYVAIGDVVVSLPGKVLPSHRAMSTAALKNAEAVPAEIVDGAHRMHGEAVEARRAARALRSGVTTRQIGSGAA